MLDNSRQIHPAGTPISVIRNYNKRMGLPANARCAYDIKRIPRYPASAQFNVDGGGRVNSKGVEIKPPSTYILLGISVSYALNDPLASITWDDMAGLQLNQLTLAGNSHLLGPSAGEAGIPMRMASGAGGLSPTRWGFRALPMGARLWESGAPLGLEVSGQCAALTQGTMVIETVIMNVDEARNQSIWNGTDLYCYYVPVVGVAVAAIGGADVAFEVRPSTDMQVKYLYGTAVKTNAISLAGVSDQNEAIGRYDFPTLANADKDSFQPVGGGTLGGMQFQRGRLLDTFANSSAPITGTIKSQNVDPGFVTLGASAEKLPTKRRAA